MVNLKQNRVPVPVVTREIGPIERHIIIFGHVLYVLATGLMVLIANSVLSFLQNIREYCAAVEESAFDANEHVDGHNHTYRQGGPDIDTESDTDNHE